MAEILQIIMITFLPLLELRASIPFGIFGTDLNWKVVFIICIISNIIIGILIFILLDWLIKLLTIIKLVEIVWNKYVEKTRRKIHRGVEKYGEWAVILFIGIPLPGSGVYSGALASFIIGLNFKKFIIADVIGVLIAGVLVTIACLTGSEIFSIFIKTM